MRIVPSSMSKNELIWEKERSMNFFYLFFQAWTEGHRVQKKTGSFLPEVANPYFRITEAGFNVESCTPNGGLAPIVRVYERQIIK